ncbi:MAG: class F420-dependent oxidoreductase [Chloroflexi bacterium]|jgi:F420-dependent oxidoreductase-like protein|nr:class F420-dependent oxidoreductase [Chloroflexota bacterium]
MIEVALMVEGQNDLNWPRWQRIARAAEDLGFVGLYRSDHYINPEPPDKDSLELWVSLTWLASHTKRIEFGPLVSPVSFRQPTMTARMASAVDDLSGGRLTLGLGAGWQEREHKNYGWELLDLPERFQRFEEGLEVISSLLNSDQPVHFEGKYYHLNDAILLPRPARPGGPPILIGGNGPRKTLPLVARYAQEWNAVFNTPENVKGLNAELDRLLEAQGRAKTEVRRSLMTRLVYGKDEAAFNDKIKAIGRSEEELKKSGIVIGNASQVVEHLGRMAEAGVQRTMLQWIEIDDMAGLEAFARDVLPQVKGS